MIQYIKEAVQLNDEDIGLPEKPKPKTGKTTVVPAYLLKELKKNKKAFATFEGFSESHKKEYVEWIIEAKTEETRNKRIKTAIEWLTEGKSRHWKYVKSRSG